jgi:hypothetical protein
VKLSELEAHTAEMEKVLAFARQHLSHVDVDLATYREVDLALRHLEERVAEVRSRVENLWDQQAALLVLDPARVFPG